MLLIFCFPVIIMSLQQRYKKLNNFPIICYHSSKTSKSANNPYISRMNLLRNGERVWMKVEIREGSLSVDILLMQNTDHLIEHLVLQDASPSPEPSTYNQKAAKAKQKYNAKQRLLKGDSIFSRLFFGWISCLLSLGNACPFDTEDLPTLPEDMRPKLEFDSLATSFKRAKRSQREGMTLLKAILRSYRGSLVVLGLLALFITVFTMAAPVLTHMIIGYIKLPVEERKTEEGVMLVAGITLLALLKALLQSHLYYQFAVLGFNLSNTLSLLVFAKALRYPALCEKRYSMSEIINYSQVDAQRMTNMGTQLTSALYTPLQIVIGVALMYRYIGVSFAAGMTAMVALIAFTFLIAKRISKVNETTLEAKDARMRVTQEILDIIRFIKVNAIEKYFFRKLDDKRNAELESNRRRGLLEVIVVFLYFVSCPLIIFLTFLTYVYMGNTIDPAVAFSTIMIFNILQAPLRQFPSALSSLIQMFTSLKRIQQFLFAPEIDNTHFLTDSHSEVAIRIDQGTFRWGVEEQKRPKSLSPEVVAYRRKHSAHSIQEYSYCSNPEILNSSTVEGQARGRLGSGSSLGSGGKERSKGSGSEISTDQFSEGQGERSIYSSAIRGLNMSIEKGKFVVILGNIGSGKSSLLYAMLNEMRCGKRTTVTLGGDIAFCAQQPCIISGTVRDNILFSLPYEKRRFQEAIHYASLRQDLKLLVKGQFTEIGEKGTNLSGGQKARISLARAIYSQRDILFLDDIVSAVDVHVAQFIVREALLRYLRGKTIVMPTHAANFAECADEVIVLRRGVITRKGHFRDICDTVEFQEVYAEAMRRQQGNENNGQDRKINLDQRKIKQTLGIIQSKRSLIKNSTTKSFADRAIEQLIIPQDHRRGEIDLGVVRQYVQQNGGALFVGLVVGAMAGWLSLSLLSNIQMESWCRSSDHPNFYLFIYLSMAVGASICAFVRAYTLVLSGFRQGELVHKKIVQALLYASLNDFYARVPTGRIMNRLTKDLRQLDETLGYGIGNFLTNLFSLCGTLAVCIYGSSPWMALPAVAVMVVCNRLRGYYMRTQREVIRIEAKTNSPIVGGFVSAIHGLPTIRAYQAEEEFLQGQMRRIQINKGSRITREALESWFAFRLTMLSFCISVLSIGWAMLDTSISPALVGLLLSYAFTLNDDIISLTFSWANLETRLVSVERIFNFMKIEPEKAYQEYCREWDPKEEGCRQVISRGELEVSNLTVRYRPDLPPALRGLSFKVKAGEKVGIVGRTGAGKSTIFSSLLRILDPSEGTILLDGQDYLSLSLKQLRSAITIIDQEPVLLNSTFRENLDFSGVYSDAELYQVLEECNLYQRVMEKDGLDGLVDNGSLSAGEKQLLCICRAFLKRSKLVLIDQATANIDHRNDALIQTVIQEKFRHSTVLTIAHRLSTLRNSDKILVMGAGKLVEWGSPTELEGKVGGIYAEMVTKNLSQFLV